MDVRRANALSGLSGTPVAARLGLAPVTRSLGSENESELARKSEPDLVFLGKPAAGSESSGSPARCVSSLRTALASVAKKVSDWHGTLRTGQNGSCSRPSKVLSGRVGLGTSSDGDTLASFECARGCDAGLAGSHYLAVPLCEQAAWA